MRINGICLILTALMLSPGVSAQTFGARAVFGANASQIGGDQLAGFDKIDIVAGLKGTARVAEKVHVNLDFLYSRRGSRPGIFGSSVDPDVRIGLQYLDLPVYVTYSDWLDEQNGFYKAYFQGGFSYGRLIQSEVSDNFNDGPENLENLQDFFNRNDFSWLIGFGFRLNRRLGIDFRYTRSITLLLDASANDLEVYSLRPYFLSLRGEFIF